MTEYKNIIDFPDYRVGDDGTIWSWKCKAGTKKKRWKQLKPWTIKGNYKVVGLKKDGDRTCRTVHGLVLECFIGPKPKGMEGCHKDNDPNNNALENLRWDSPKNNCKDRTKHGVHIANTGRGSRHGMHKLIENEVIEIRDYFEKGIYSRAHLSEMYNISYRNICDIIARNIWRHI